MGDNVWFFGSLAKEFCTTKRLLPCYSVWTEDKIKHCLKGCCINQYEVRRTYMVDFKKKFFCNEFSIIVFERYVKDVPKRRQNDVITF